jgi:hypothetical protein
MGTAQAYILMRDHAKQLERELNALRREITPKGLKRPRKLASGTGAYVGMSNALLDRQEEAGP